MPKLDITAIYGVNYIMYYYKVRSVMAKKNAEYGNDSIEKLEGADRVRKRPAVIFGSDGIEGCEHSVFEIISNSIDEAREGFGS